MLKIRPNGDMIVDKLVTDSEVNGLKSIKEIKCPNLYGLDNSALGVSSDYETMEDLTKGLLTNWNFEDGTTDWTKSTNATFSVTDGIASLGGDGNDDYIQKTFTLTAGRTYVFIIRGKNNNGFPNYFQQGFSEEPLAFTTEYSYVRFVATIGSTQTSFAIKIGPVQPDGYDRSGTILNLDTVSVFDVTDLKSKALYSPQYNDTFDNITNDNQIAYQLQILTEGKDYYGTPSDYVNDSYADFKTAANGTGSGLLNGRYYFNYDNDVIHDLLTIYGAGNEPSLETHEALIPQYTNTVLKAKAFANTLQQEFMEMNLDTPVYEGLSLRDIFETNNLVVNGESFESGWSILNGSGSVNDGIYSFTVIAQGGNLRRFDMPIVATNKYFVIASVKASSNQVSLRLYDGTYIEVDYHSGSGEYETLYGVVYGVNTTSIGRPVIHDNSSSGWAQIDVDYIRVINMSDTSIFTTVPSQLQLDEWLDMYLTLKGSTTNTGTEFYQDRYYVDYDNAKVYDYNIIEPYVSETPADKEAYMAQVIAHTIIVTAIPVKAKIYKDRFVILGSYTVIGE